MSCYDCQHYRTEPTQDDAPYCGKTHYWIGVHDISYCCAYYKEGKE